MVYEKILIIYDCTCIKHLRREFVKRFNNKRIYLYVKVEKQNSYNATSIKGELFF